MLDEVETGKQELIDIFMEYQNKETMKKHIKHGYISSLLFLPSLTIVKKRAFRFACR